MHRVRSSKSSKKAAKRTVRLAFSFTFMVHIHCQISLLALADQPKKGVARGRRGPAAGPAAAGDQHSESKDDSESEPSSEESCDDDDEGNEADLPEKPNFILRRGADMYLVQKQLERKYPKFVRT